MSWNASTKGPVLKQNLPEALAGITDGEPLNGPMYEQLEAARRAAKELAKTVPGPHLAVSMSGHANGVGWQKKEGWANDTITVTVSQVTE